MLLSKLFYTSKPLHVNLIALICEIFLGFSVKNFSLWPQESTLQTAFSSSTWKIGSHRGCLYGTSDIVEPLQLFWLFKKHNLNVAPYFPGSVCEWSGHSAVVIRGLGRKRGEGLCWMWWDHCHCPPLLYDPLLPCLINISAPAGNLPFQWAANPCFRYKFTVIVEYKKKIYFISTIE